MTLALRTTSRKFVPMILSVVFLLCYTVGLRAEEIAQNPELAQNSAQNPALAQNSAQNPELAQNSAANATPAQSSDSAAAATPAPAPAEKPNSTSKNGEAFAVYVENDTRAMGGPGSDQAYSNGFKFSYVFAEDRIPAFAYPTINRLNFLESINHTASNFGMAVGHQIYTPNNKGAVNLIPDDRPYAGYLYVAFAMNLKDEKQEHLVELDLGIVGPSAHGQEVQNNWHTMSGIDHFEGWKNELNDEPTLQITYQRRMRVLQQKHWDFIPYYGAGLGNVRIAAHAGALVRLGTSLPENFGPSRPSASDGDSFVAPTKRGAGKRDLSFYGFLGARGNGVAHNLFLDGNTWKESHHVRKRFFVLDTEIGVGAQYLPWSVVWRFITRSPEFYDSARPASFASINIVYFLGAP